MGAGHLNTEISARLHERHIINSPQTTSLKPSPRIKLLLATVVSAHASCNCFEQLPQNSGANHPLSHINHNG